MYNSSNSTAVVTVFVLDDASSGAVLSTVSAAVDAKGNWVASLTTPVPAKQSTTIVASASVHGAPVGSNATLRNVAWGDVLICGGQSNMAFALCSAVNNNTAARPGQTAFQAVQSVSFDANPLRNFMEAGGPAPHGEVQGNICKSHPEVMQTPVKQWFNASVNTSGGYSAVCILTAERLRAHLGGDVPVGTVMSCIGGTNVEPWTPPNGSLYQAHIVPLLPMTFKAAVWDQGEADAKRTSSAYYTTEFPKMIEGWRAKFETPLLPFVYVELCTEYGAEEPKEGDFWQAQRAATALPDVGFATTTDIQRDLHPPDKQDVADRLALEIRRLAYGEEVIARGPELVTKTVSGNQLTITFSNATLEIRGGILVDHSGNCTGSFEQERIVGDSKRESRLTSTAVMQVNAKGVAEVVPFTMSGNQIIITCLGSVASQPVVINADCATCFVYGPNQLPAPPLSITCSQ
jgi:sialate O-acetylesterase